MYMWAGDQGIKENFTPAQQPEGQSKKCFHADRRVAVKPGQDALTALSSTPKSTSIRPQLTHIVT
ncbi:hypothetical protein C0Q70_03054 [Pomacea canaliculata]|uniref:Uncharacterized protein n=1 Tax=Pomacea canaliculata TaxID=400727 RepID=A0A2T7PRN3_POMCA|nr:hypothetical protein C0Q70_03054 [Pomacea canaliculata]